MNVIAFFATLLLATCPAKAQANANPKQQFPPGSSDATETKRRLSPPSAPLRLVKSMKLIITETSDATIQGEHKHAVITAEHTIRKVTKTTIRFDTFHIINSSSDEYFTPDSDAQDQEFSTDSDHLSGEWGEPTDIYVETPVFNGNVHVLYRHDRAVGEIRRWVSTNPIELELKLEDGSRVRVRADYAKEFIQLNGTYWGTESFALYDFGLLPVWTRDTQERPGETKELTRVLTGIQYSAKEKSHR